MTDERRQYSRIAFAAPAHLLLGEQVLRVEVLDLSLKGALLRLPDQADPGHLAVGTAAVLDVPLDQSGQVIRMQATVAHLDDGRAGLLCRSIDVDSVSHLRRLVELNLGDADLLQRELSALLSP
jgi:hypothetical protein